MAYELPELPYAYDALEPHIDAETMEIHHGKHHQGYTNKLNAALEGHPDLQAKSIEALLGDLAAVPEAIRGAVRNNGGGWSNHSLFWESMGPKMGEEGVLPVIDAISETFGGFNHARELFGNAAKTRFGSGWAWFALNGDKKLECYSTANQDSPLMQGHAPILGLDVWEHAYYLKYQNRRPDYVAAFWEVVNWGAVNDRYLAAMGA